MIFFFSFFSALQNSANFTGSFSPKYMEFYFKKESSEEKMLELLDELCQVGRSPTWRLKDEKKKHVLPIFYAYICFHGFLVTLNILSRNPEQPTRLVI